MGSYRDQEIHVFLLALQAVLIGLYSAFVDYDDTGAIATADVDWRLILDVLMLLLLAFPLAFSFLPTYSLSGMGLSFMVAAYACQLGILVFSLFEKSLNSNDSTIRLTSSLVGHGLSGAMAVLVSFGATLGKVSPLQLIMQCTFCLVLWGAVTFLVDEWNVWDGGKTISVFLFGSSYGFVFAFFIDYPKPYEGKDSARLRCLSKRGTANNMLSWVGTAFVAMLAHSWYELSLTYVSNRDINTAHAHIGTRMSHVVVNSLLASCTSGVAALSASAVFAKSNKVDLEAAQKGVLGGVFSLGPSVVLLEPSGVMGIAMSAAVVGTVSSLFLSNQRRRPSWSRSDTFGVLSSFFFPGLVGVIGNVIALRDVQTVTIASIGVVQIESEPEGMYAVAALVAVAIGVLGGAISSFITRMARWVGRNPKQNGLMQEYVDDEHFVVADDYVNLSRIATDARPYRLGGEDAIVKVPQKFSTDGDL